jgi:hypothetical protein
MHQLILVLFAASLASSAMAGSVLFVSYNDSDGSVGVALAADGHDVTQVNVPPETANDYFSGADLAGYCAVIWSAAYAYERDVSTATAVLTAWVQQGGSILVTAPDAIRAQSADMIGFLGGSSARDENLNFSPVANLMNSVTTGLVDIRGQTPPDISDQDTLCGPLLPGTVGLVTGTLTPDSTCPDNEGYAWTLRSLGQGEIAFITSGNFTSDDDPDWSSTVIPGDGVYNAGLRNFVHAACRPRAIPAQPVPALSIWSLMLLGALLLMIGLTRQRG